MSKPSYTRIIQWAAGPISALAGLAATFVVNQFHIFATLGINKNAIGAAIYNVGVFAVTAGVTYAAHHKWLSNLTHWWDLPPAHRATLLHESPQSPVHKSSVQDVPPPPPPPRVKAPGV